VADVRLESGNDKGDRLYRRFLDGDANALAELTGLYREKSLYTTL